MDKYWLNTPNWVYDEKTHTFIQIRKLAVDDNDNNKITGTLPKNSIFTVEQAQQVVVQVFDVAPEQVNITKKV